MCVKRFKKRKVIISDNPFRGPWRIRTAVAAFAELSLATRPKDPIYFSFQILHFRFESETATNISRLFKRL